MNKQGQHLVFHCLLSCSAGQEGAKPTNRRRRSAICVCQAGFPFRADNPSKDNALRKSIGMIALGAIRWVCIVSTNPFLTAQLAWCPGIGNLNAMIFWGNSLIQMCQLRDSDEFELFEQIQLKALLGWTDPGCKSKSSYRSILMC